MNGCARYKEQTCFITGHDPDTGEELWRTSTIALPGDPNDAGASTTNVTWRLTRPSTPPSRPRLRRTAMDDRLVNR